MTAPAARIGSPGAAAAPRGDVLWLCLPWQAVSRANLGLALTSALVRDVAPVSSLYANLRFARQIGQDLYGRVQSTRFAAEGLFTPTAFGLRGADLEAWLRRAAPPMRDEAGLEPAEVERLASGAIPRFVAAVADELIQRRPAILGMSLLVNQVVPCVAVARAVKAVAPDIRVLVGGSGAAGPMGAALLESFDAFDVAVTGEVASSIAPLIERLRDGQSLAGVPGVAYRETGPDGGVRRNARAPLDVLDELPVPDYSDFVSQFRGAGLDGDLWLPFEASRGCWWGEHMICSFCGLNGENVTYRRKSAAKVAEEIAALHERYRVSQFCATDNILPADAEEELLPALTRVRRRIPGLRIYYQMKSSVSRELLGRLVEAGVTVVQPGIESFDDNILRLMRKGAPGLSQIRAIKLLTEAGIEAIYGILHGTVGETAQNLRDQAALIPALHHLQPPSYYSPISLDRFSPYAEAPAHYGIELRPVDHSELLYPDPAVDRLGITGVFRMHRSTPPHPVLDAGIAELGAAVARWQEAYRPGMCSYAVLPGPVVHIEDNRGPQGRRLRLDGVRAEVLVGTDEAVSLRDVARRAGRPFDEVSSAADALHADRLIVRRRDRAVALPTRWRRGAVIGLTGLPCAGKSTLVHTARALGVSCLDVGEVIRLKFGDEAYELTPAEKVRLLGKSDSVFWSLGPELRDAFRPDGLLLVDSFKATADLAVVREEVPDAMVEALLVTADPKLRAARFVSRARPDDGPSLAEKERKLDAIGIGIGTAVEAAAWTLVNDGSPEEFRRRVERFIQSVLASLSWAAD